MQTKDEKQEDVTAEEEEIPVAPIVPPVPPEQKDDPPRWMAGIEEAKRIMEACLDEAHDLYMCYYQTKFAGVGTKAPQTGDQNITNLAIAMYQSIVMMEMERGRRDGARIQMLASGLEVPTGQILKGRS